MDLRLALLTFPLFFPLTAAAPQLHAEFNVNFAPSAPLVAFEASEHFFSENHEKPFSWNNPNLQKRLWSGHTKPTAPLAQPEHQLQRRALKSFGPAIQILSCLGCAQESSSSSGTDLLNECDTNYFETRIIVPLSQLHDKCVFYTSRKEQYKNPTDKDTWTLSKLCTENSCNRGFVTIWNLWTGNNNNAPSGVDVSRDHYAMFVDGSWLQPVRDLPEEVVPGGTNKPGYIPYFENMSRAMALQCTGNVWVMSDEPQRLSDYGFIWGTVELVALRSRVGQGIANLYAVDAKTFQYYQVDWNSLVATGPLGDWGPLASTKENGEFVIELPPANETDSSHLQRRDSCTANVYKEPAGYDWFG